VVGNNSYCCAQDQFIRCAASEEQGFVCEKIGKISDFIFCAVDIALHLICVISSHRQAPAFHRPTSSLSSLAL